MGDDDKSTVTTITSYRKIVAELMIKHYGRVVDSPGNSILVEFKSAFNAITAKNNWFNEVLDITSGLNIWGKS